MVMYLKRHLETDLSKLLRSVPAVGIVGPRQVGKTSLAKHISAENTSKKPVYLDLERPSDLRRLADAETFLASTSDRQVIIDEVQRAEGLFPILRGEIDRDRRSGRFLLLGSASPTLLRTAGESLAGRIAYLELHGLTIAELQGVVEPKLRWLRGGFAESVLATNDETSLRWRENYITSYIERDLPQLGLRADPILIRRLWRMVAHLSAQLLNAETIGRSLGITGKTVRAYLDFLESSYLIRRVQPYYANLGKRLIKSPKIYVRDSGLLHRLLGVRDEIDLAGRPERGASFESFVIEEIAANLPFGWELSFYRTANGAELDILLLRDGLPTVAIEVKASSAPSPARGFYTSCEDLGISKRYLLGMVDESYPTRNGIMVIGIGDLSEVFKD